MSRPVLKLAADLELGIDAVTQRFAFLARSGAGKTYGASKLAEEMLGAGAQVLVIDPVGCWYALRVGADGKSKGFDIVVLGGLHGDLPLDPGSGALVADLVVERGISAVLDVSMMRKGDRKKFAQDFAEQLFHRKKSKKSPVHLFLEEAQVFVPQRVQPDEARMLGAFEDVVKLGRNFGIGVTLISQRPQAVNKDALNQTECLVVLQTNGAQERKALKEWIVEAGIDVGVDLIATLPGLQRGEAWVWSPSWLRVTKRVVIAKKRTLNASATPEHGETVEAKPLAPIDLEQLRDAMAATVAKAAAADPAKLQKRVADLERELLAMVKKHAAERDRLSTEAITMREVVEKPVLKDGQLKRMEDLVAKWEGITQGVAKQLQVTLQPLIDAMAKLHLPPVLPYRPDRIDAAHPRRPGPPAAPRHAPVEGPTTTAQADGADVKLGRCELAILGALAVRRPERLTRNQLTLISGYTNSGGFRNAMSSLRSQGLIETGADGLTALTTAGEAHVGHVRAPRGPQEVFDHWIGQLGLCERAILNVLAQHYPSPVMRDELPGLAGYTNSGGYRNALSRLRTLTLAVNEGGGIRASDEIGGAR